MFTIPTMMTTAFRYYFSALTATKAAVVPSSAPFMVTLPQEKPVAKRTFDNYNNNDDEDEQPRKRRKVQCENSILEPVAQASMKQVTTASAPADTAMEDLTGSYSKLLLATKSNNSSSAVNDLVRSFHGLAISNTTTADSAMEELTGRFSKLLLATKSKSNHRSAIDDLVISFNGLAISNISSKGNNDTAKNAIRNDSMDSGSCYRMDVFDDDDDKSDIDNNDNDDDDMMDIDSGYMMDIDTDDETERMDTTE